MENPQVINRQHYQYVLENDMVPYETFRANYELKEKAGVSYYEAGKGPILLLLPGSTGRGISFFEYMMELSQDFHVITVDYPKVEGLNELAEKMLGFIKTLEEEKIHVFCHSFGSVLAQEMLKRQPDLFDQVIIAHGLSKDKLVGKSTIRNQQKSIRSFMRSISFLGYERFLKRFSKRLRRSFHIFPDDTSKRLFWEGFYEEMLYTTPKEIMLSNYHFMRDFWLHFVFEKDDFKVDSSKVHIIESYSDHQLNMPEKQALKALFEDADYHILEGDSANSLIKNKSQLIAMINEKCNVSEPH